MRSWARRFRWKQIKAIRGLTRKPGLHAATTTRATATAFESQNWGTSLIRHTGSRSHHIRTARAASRPQVVVPRTWLQCWPTLSVNSGAAGRRHHKIKMSLELSEQEDMDWQAHVVKKEGPRSDAWRPHMRQELCAMKALKSACVCWQTWSRWRCPPPETALQGEHSGETLQMRWHDQHATERQPKLTRICTSRSSKGRQPKTMANSAWRSGRRNHFGRQPSTRPSNADVQGRFNRRVLLAGETRSTSQRQTHQKRRPRWPKSGNPLQKWAALGSRGSSQCETLPENSSRPNKRRWPALVPEQTCRMPPTRHRRGTSQVVSATTQATASEYWANSNIRRTWLAQGWFSVSAATFQATATRWLASHCQQSRVK